MYDSTRRCTANARRRRNGIVTIKQRNPGNRHSENHALDQTVHQIHPQIDGVLHGRPEESGINAFPVNANQRASPDTYRHKEDSQ